MVGVEELKEMRLNPCRSVVNNLGVVKIEGLAVLRDKLDRRNLIYWSSGNRHIEGKNSTYGSITEQEKLLLWC